MYVLIRRTGVKPPARVELSDDANGTVVADAVYVVPTPTPPATPDSYVWTPDIPAAADDQVYARWTAAPDRATAADYVIETASGVDVVTVNQRQGGGVWNLLGRFALDAGTGNRIVLNAEGADGTVVADAVRIVREVATGDVAWLHTDHLATPQKMTDAAAAVVWDRQQRPFGETHAESGSAATDLRFPGQWFDAESALHYNYFRDYDPSLGRYIQSDPIGLAGGVNTYGYAEGNPVSFVDPDGLTAVPVPPQTAVICFTNPAGAVVCAATAFCIAFPDQCVAAGKAVADACMNIVDIILSYEVDEDEDEIDCDKLYKDDTDTCNAVTRRRGRAADQRCHASASERYAACLAGKPIPPLDVWNN